MEGNTPLGQRQPLEQYQPLGEDRPPGEGRLLRAEQQGAMQVARTDAAHASLPAGLPNPRIWAAHLATCAVQVILGRRSVPQLTGWASARAISDLLDHSPSDLHPGRVRSVRCLPIKPGVVEAVVVLDSGPRSRALAMRLEAVNVPLRPGRRRIQPGPRWLATSLRIL